MPLLAFDFGRFMSDLAVTWLPVHFFLLMCFVVYLLWRMVEAAQVTRRVLATAPLALLAVALYAFGFWVLLQPMQMRGMMMGAM